MKPIHHYTVPQFALWKSCVAEILSKAGKNQSPNGSDLDHEIMEATDHYLTAMETNSEFKCPGKDSNDKLKVGAYLSYLHHRMAHAKIAKDKKEEKRISDQIAEYKFGNPLWQQMFIQYYKYYWQYPYHKGAQPVYRSWQDDKYGNNDLQYGVIEWRLPVKARIAIVGDIGTGTDIAANVLHAACKFRPDAILHLGDVYFSGTKREVKTCLVDMVRQVLKKEKLNIPFFTIPGNHEYFTGNVALLNALDSDQLISAPNQKQSTSYFCLKTEDDGWQFLGMDTGYFGHYMNVAKGASKATLDYLHIGDIEQPTSEENSHWPKDHNPYFPDITQDNLAQKDTTSPVAMVTVRPDEVQWHHDKLKNFDGRTVLLSHHQLYSALNVLGIAQGKLEGSDQLDPNDVNRSWVNTELWAQFGPFLQDKVALWLWGHEHNLLIFEDNYRPEDWPVDDSFKATYQNLVKGRCAGHSALPVQDTEEPYKVLYPVPLKQNDLQLGLTTIGADNWYNNGFQIMELAGKGNPARLSYFQVTPDQGIPLPLFMETIQ